MHPDPNSSAKSSASGEFTPEYTPSALSHRRLACEPEAPGSGRSAAGAGPISRLLAVIDHIPLGIAITAPDGTIEYLNPRLSASTGLPAADAAGIALDSIRLAEEAGTFDQIRPLLMTRGWWQGEVRYRERAGGFFYALESVCTAREPDGTVAGFVHFVQDMTSQKLVETLRRLAFYDSLTGLPNRSLIEDRLALAIAHARRRRTSFAVLCIDMDQFKQVNDTLGHATGDQLLAAVAQRLQAALRTTDTLGRWGGDEFVAIVEDAQRTDALLTVANKLVATGERPYWIGDRQYRMTLSIGASLYPDHAHDQAGLLAVADAAMYRAKAAGGNTWRVPSP